MDVVVPLVELVPLVVVEPCWKLIDGIVVVGPVPFGRMDIVPYGCSSSLVALDVALEELVEHDVVAAPLVSAPSASVVVAVALLELSCAVPYGPFQMTLLRQSELSSFLELRASWNDVVAVVVRLAAFGAVPFDVLPSYCSADIRSLVVAGTDSFAVVVEVVVAPARRVEPC